MAQVDVGLIREKLAERLALLDGLFAYAYAGESVQAGPAGAALIQDAEAEESIAYHQVGGVDNATLRFDVVLLAPTTNPADAARWLDAYRGVGTERSVLTNLESGGNLGGACQYVVVRSVGPLRRYAQQGEIETQMWEVTFAVEVHAG